MITDRIFGVGNITGANVAVGKLVGNSVVGKVAVDAIDVDVQRGKLTELGVAANWGHSGPYD